MRGRKLQGSKVKEHDRGKIMGKMEKNKKSCARGKENKRKRKKGEGKAKGIIKDEKGQHKREGLKEHRKLTVGVREEVQAEERRTACFVQQCKKGGQQKSKGTENKGVQEKDDTHK